MRTLIIDKSILKKVNFKIALLDESLIPTHFYIAEETFSLLQKKMEDSRVSDETKRNIEFLFNKLLDLAEKSGGIKNLYNGGVSLDSFISNKGSKISIKNTDKDSSASYQSISLWKSLNNEEALIYTIDATLVLHAYAAKIPTIRLKSLSLKKGYKTFAELNQEEIGLVTQKKVFPRLSRNEFIINGAQVFREKDGRLIQEKFSQMNINAIEPKNIDQKMMLALLRDPDIPVVLLTGIAGIGKTFLALSEFYRGYKAGVYERFYVSRPNVSFEDNGSKPGTEKEKVSGVLKTVLNKLKELRALMPNEQLFKDMIQDFEAPEGEEKNDILKIVSFGEIQGETFLPKSFAFLDEAQNATDAQIHSFFTRCGKDVKMVFAGDLAQVANPKLSIYNNGLLTLERNTRGQSLVGTLYSKRAVRSNVAQLGAEIFS